MPRNNNGSFAPPTNSASPAAPLTPISSADFNTLIGDIVGGLADSLSRSGKGGMQTALDMGGFAINNLGAPTGPNSPARLSDVTALQGTLKALAFKDTVSNADWAGADLSIENGGTGASTAASARSNLGLGTAATSNAAAFATAAQGALAASAVQPSRMIATGAGLTGGGTLGQDRTLALSQASQDSLTLANTAVQPGSLGALAAKNTVSDADWSGTDLSIANGGTGASTASAARTNLGLGTAATANAADFATAAQGALAGTAVQPARTISAGTGLTGGGDLSANRTVALSAASITSLGRADTAVQPARTVAAGAGLAGGGDLSADRTIALSPQTQSALIPAGGATGQTLTKTGAGDYVFAWSTPAGGGDMLKSENLSGLADNSVARSNIGLGNVANKTEAQMVASGAIADALAGKQAAGSYEPARTAVTQAIAEAGTDTVIRGWSAQRVRQGAVAADPEVLVASYSAAQLNGLSQVVLDLPTGFSTFRLLIETVASGAQGDLQLRCGVAGGALNQGASDYTVIVQGFEGNSPIDATVTASFVGLGSIESSGYSLIEAIVNDGSVGGFWRAKISEIGRGTGGFRFADRMGVLSAASGARKRLAILTTQPFASSGSIKIYGVRP